MENVLDIEWRSMQHAVPAFLTIAVIPLTYSIAYGVIAGVMSYIVLWVLFLVYDLVTAPLYGKTIGQVRARYSSQLHSATNPTPNPMPAAPLQPPPLPPPFTGPAAPESLGPHACMHAHARVQMTPFSCRKPPPCMFVEPLRPSIRPLPAGACMLFSGAAVPQALRVPLA